MITDAHEAVLWPDFEADFWPEYERKGSRMLSRKEWDKLSQKDKEAAMAGTAPYVASTPEKRYRLDGERYLKYRKWEDELVPAAQPKNGTEDYVRSSSDALARKLADRQG